VLYATLIATAHEGVTFFMAGMVALRAIGAAALLGYFVYRLTDRWPWPNPVRPGFVAGHVVGAGAYTFAWVGLTSLIESILRLRLVVIMPPSGIVPYLILGVWIYVMVAGVAYAARGTERAARAEATAARSQLAALRSQLNPHFLFNALHTVVHLIPKEPKRAAQAAEQIAGLLRTALGEERDLVPLSDELAFVDRYLEIERIRFGDRLRVRVDLSPEARRAWVPSFALQTLVENAVRHGAAPRIEPTEVAIVGQTRNGSLELAVSDTGAGATAHGIAATNGTGLRRLRERLVALYGDRARLDLAAGPAGGTTAALLIPIGDGE
jgi:signal transduction histidine kinase